MWRGDNRYGRAVTPHVETVGSVCACVHEREGVDTVHWRVADAGIMTMTTMLKYSGSRSVTSLAIPVSSVNLHPSPIARAGVYCTSLMTD